MIVPDRDTFISLSKRGNLIPVYREMMADRLTPVSAFEKLSVAPLENGADASSPDNPYAFLLESVEGGERIGRYSYLGSKPSLVFRSKGRKACITEDGITRSQEIPQDQDPLSLLKEIMCRYQYVESPDLPRFCGGAVGFFGYDVVRFFENLPDTNPDEITVDDACFLFTDTLVIFDHVRHKIQVVCNAHIPDATSPEGGAPSPPHPNSTITELASRDRRPPDRGTDTATISRAYDEAVEKIRWITERLAAPHSAPSVHRPKLGAAPVVVQHLTPRDDYEAAVERCREYILAGDAFQIVLSQRFKLEFTAPPFDLYRALRSVNPSPYMYYLDMGERKIIGTSPEILVTAEQGMVRSRPIAGTRPRGATAEEDRRLEKELLADEKERAEHIMLVDLSRNDVGRVCDYGSVRVKELMVVERYSHVMHIVSDVVGRLRPDKDVFDVLRACFPHGTVSGAPKVRAMQIIDEQETTRRGFYAGCAGYISYSGGMDMAITIRTMMVDGQTAYLQAGGGLVADSVPAMEYQECVNKARALVHAIELAEAGLD